MSEHKSSVFLACQGSKQSECFKVSDPEIYHSDVSSTEQISIIPKTPGISWARAEEPDETASNIAEVGNIAQRCSCKINV